MRAVRHPTFTHVPSQLSWRIVSCVLSGRARFRLRNERRVCGRLRFSGKRKRKRADILHVTKSLRSPKSGSQFPFPQSSLDLESNEARGACSKVHVERLAWKELLDQINEIDEILLGGCARK